MKEIRNKKNALLILFLALIAAVIVFGLLRSKFFGPKTILEETANLSQEEIIVKETAPSEIKKMIRNEEYQLVDIRQSTDFEIAHIEDSINLPLSEIEEGIKKINKNKKVVIIDKEPTKKGKILVSYLEKNGYQASYLKGGILEYLKEGYEVVSQGDPTLVSDLVKVSSYSALEIKEKIKSEGIFSLLDVRDPLSYKKDHLKGSVNIPLEDLEKEKANLPRGKIIVFDSDPLRSFRAAVRLYDMNVLDVYNCLDSYEELKKVLQENEAPASP